ncbi:MAG: T9SS type A sorting domain-containing protein [Ignavibacteria bacterium]|nr:T9SS type A sorting domain-containing protein [Ignavibacteria bacterium]
MEFNIWCRRLGRYFFKDSLSGWRSLISINNVRSTTDGGINWSTILIAKSGNPSKEINQFSVINDDTIWGIGSYIYFPNLESRGIILKTTTGGKNWGYQLPDTSIRINGSYSYLNFINNNIGWSYANSTTGVHTIKGGDTISYIYTGIQSLNNNVSSDFELFQNYPNPFNPSTKIKYKLNKSGFVNIKVFNILGKEIEVLINARQSAGEYGVSFDASNYPGGVYFYSLYVDNKIIDTKKMILIR